MTEKTPLLPSQRIIQICLFLATAIAMMGGPLQMYLGEPETTARLDNVHRFMAGIYWGMGFTALWAAFNVRKLGSLTYVLALSPFLGAVGRVISILHVGLPSPAGLWIGYLIPELVIPVVIVGAHLATNRSLRQGTPQLTGA